ncbi:MAG: toxic anion resistance protein [Ruminococcaceae bacterium]|nr:toxic anion resistance protein [Oscillospiraceae bacterium]
MMNEKIELTLDPFGGAAAAAPAPAPEPAVPAEPAAPALDESAFSETERKMIEDFSQKIDITDSTTILGYGASAQKKISDFSDTALNGVRNKDFGETGEMITTLIGQLREMNDDAEDEGGFLGLFKSTKRKIENLKTKYDKVEASVNDITANLQQHQITLLKDVAMFDNLYEVNMTYFKELTMYILAGKKKLQQEKDVTLKALQDKAAATGLPEDAQAANDFAEQCVRFERKIHDLELTRMVAVQMAPQIRLVQNNDTMMAEKIQTVIMNTIPLWKSQMVIALGIEHSRQAMEAQRAVTDMTNELLKKNAAALHQATVDITRESERGVVDIETLTQTNTELIATLDDVAAIQAEGRDKRQAAEAELVRIENELKAKLIGMAQ